MCWLHPGLAFKLPCVLLSLFMISVTLASLPCHFTNCCWGVYGQVPFPNVSDFSGACPETISFYGVVTEMVFFLPGKGLPAPSECMCVPAEIVCVQGKAGQLHNCRENGGGDCESPTYSLWETCILWFCRGVFRPRQAKKNKKDTGPLLVTKFITCGKQTRCQLRDEELQWESQLSTAGAELAVSQQIVKFDLTMGNGATPWGQYLET